MKIVLATGIFPPAIGGPATIVEALKDSLAAKGHQVEVVTFSDDCSGVSQQNDRTIIHCLRRTNTFFNYLRYFFKLNSLVKKDDLVLAFDAISVGGAAALVKKIRGNKLAIRLGGDFLWEQSVARGLSDCALPDFYRQKFNRWQNLRFKIINWSLKTADKIVLTNRWFFKIIKEPYGLMEGKIEIIRNFYPPTPVKGLSRSQTAVAAGRFIKIKNFEKLIAVFNSLDEPNARLVIYGSGPLKKELKKLIDQKANNRVELRPAISQPELLKQLASCRFYIQASLSEVSPNTVLQALSVQTPVLLTSYCGYTEFLKDRVTTFNPFDPEDLKNKLKLFYNEDFYAGQREAVRRVDCSYGLTEAVMAYENLLLNL